LAGGIAHDFNNLLTIINGCAEAMTEEEPQESMSGRLAREILKAGERAAKLTGQLLVFGRQQVTSTETVDLGSIVSGMTEMLARLLGPRVTLAASISPGPRPLIMGNSIQMEQVVLNLIVNARDALPSGGTVNVRVDVLET